jgi:hypothetical protein
MPPFARLLKYLRLLFPCKNYKALEQALECEIKVWFAKLIRENENVSKM